MNDILQCYAILGIKHTATPEATRKAYRNMAKVWHPDRYVNNPTLRAKAEIEIKKINQAYEAIKAYSANNVEEKAEHISHSPRPRPRVARKQVSSESYYQEGVAYAEQENYEAALNSFAQAIKLNADYLEAYQYRGFILSKLGYKLRADAEFKKAHQIKVKNTKKSYAPQYTPQYSSQQSTAQTTVKAQTHRPLQYVTTILADDRPVECIAISKNQTFASVGDREIKLWQLSSGQRIGTLQGHTDKVTCLIMSPSGQTLISSSRDRTIKFWDLRKKKIVRTFGGQFDDHLSEITNLAISPNNQTLLSCDLDNSLKVWDINHARVLKTVSFSADVTCLAIHPNGQLFCSGGLESQIRIGQTKNGQLVDSINNNSGILSLAFSRDGRLLATGGFNHQINLWELATGRLIHTFEGHLHRVSSVVFSNDGQTLISGSWDGTIKLWELSTGKEVASVEAHADKINTLAIASDNRTLISGSSDRTIKLWQCNYLATENSYFTAY